MSNARRLRIAATPWRAVSAALAAAFLAIACGGGVDTGGTGAPMQSFSAGSISGFGSIIVNGVRFDDSSASVIDDDGVQRPRSDLKLGMIVGINAGAMTTDLQDEDTTTHSVAARIQYGSDIKGPVQSVDASAGTMRVLDQTVKVDAGTVFDGLTNGVNGIQTGMLLEVFAFFDPTSGIYTATRVERKSSLALYQLRGVLTNLDTTAKTFKMGSATISYSGLPTARLPDWSNGARVRVKLQTQPLAGQWLLTGAHSEDRPIENGSEANLDGFITHFESPSSFEVNGRRVDASGASVVFTKGAGADLADGVRIKVEGEIQDGVLVAAKVEFKRAAGQGQEFDLRGEIESADAAQRSFVLRGVTVIHDTNTKFTQGSAADLQPGVALRVKGVLARSGTQVLATKIKVIK